MPVANLNIGLYYRITRQDSHKSVVIKRDSDPPTLVEVGGRWTINERPRRRSFTTWAGDDPYRMDVPVLFDGWDDNGSVEDEIALLNQMQISPSDYSKPPQIKIEGAVPVKDATWVLDPHISWGTNVIWHPAGYRLRQDAVIHLLQYIAPDSLTIRPPATARTYKVKKGDTLKSISRDEYGTPKYWSALKSANNIRDVKKLPANLKIPVIVNP